MWIPGGCKASPEIWKIGAQPEECGLLSGGYLVDRWGQKREESDHFHLCYFSVCAEMPASCLGDSLMYLIHLPLWIIDLQHFMFVRSAGLQAEASFMDERQIYRQKDK